MKKNSKTVVSVDVSNVRTRNTWGSVKPYTRVEMPKTAYKRQGKGALLAASDNIAIGRLVLCQPAIFVLKMNVQLYKTTFCGII